MTGREIQQKLSAYFPAKSISWLPKIVGQKDGDRSNMALALAYLEADVIMNRLDNVLGCDWRDEYTIIHSDKGRNVTCKLWIKVEGEWICREDVGGEKKMQDEGDVLKTGFTDALKRAAVKWGIGRYLHDIPKTWFACKREKRKDGRYGFVEWVKEPAIPDRFNPEKTADPQKAASPAAQPQQTEPAKPTEDKTALLKSAKTGIPNAKDFFALEKIGKWILQKQFDAPAFNELMVSMAARAGQLVAECVDVGLVNQVVPWARTIGMPPACLGVVEAAVKSKLSAP